MKERQVRRPRERKVYDLNEMKNILHFPVSAQALLQNVEGLN